MLPFILRIHASSFAYTGLVLLSTLSSFLIWRQLYHVLALSCVGMFHFADLSKPIFVITWISPQPSHLRTSYFIVVSSFGTRALLHVQPLELRGLLCVEPRTRLATTAVLSASSSYWGQRRFIADSFPSDIPFFLTQPSFQPLDLLLG